MTETTSPPSPAAPRMLDAYDPSAVEAKWRRIWEERGDHRTERSADDERNGELNDVPLVEEVTKAFHGLLLVPRVSRMPHPTRRPPKGSAW